MVNQNNLKSHIFEGSSPGVSPGACEPRIGVKPKMELALSMRMPPYIPLKRVNGLL